MLIHKQKDKTVYSFDLYLFSRMQEIVTASFLVSFEFHQAIFGSLTILYHINLDILIKVIGQVLITYLHLLIRQMM